ncbi:MAG: hypothetical protein ACI8R9_000779 [Paraglaciecola sp.]
MIDIFHASESLQKKLQNIENERELVQLVLKNLSQYRFASRVDHSELQSVFAATGSQLPGEPAPGNNADGQAITCKPVPTRATQYNDILLERKPGFIHLATPAGFIPLVDAIERNGFLHKRLLN